MAQFSSESQVLNSHVSPDDSEDLSKGIQKPGSLEDAGEEGHSEHDKKSLYSVVKEKAKDKIHKLTTKLKKGSKNSGHDGGNDDHSQGDESEEFDLESAENNKQTVQRNEDEDVFNGKSSENFGVGTREPWPSNVSAEAGPVGGSYHSPVQTDFSDSRATVNAVMPASVIEPKSATEEGERSSNHLGNIREAPNEEAREIETESRDQARSKDLSYTKEPTEGRLESSHPESSLHSSQKDSSVRERGAELRASGSDDLKSTDLTKLSSWRETELGRDNPEDEGSRERDPSKETPCYSGLDADLSESEELDTKQSQPSRDESEGLGRTGPETDGLQGENRDLQNVDKSESKTHKPLRDPEVEMPIPESTKLSESMFSSDVTEDLRRNSPPTEENTEPDYSNDSIGAPSVTGRGLGVGSGERLSEADDVTPAREEAEDKEICGDKFYDPVSEETGLNAVRMPGQQAPSLTREANPGLDYAPVSVTEDGGAISAVDRNLQKKEEEADRELQSEVASGEPGQRTESVARGTNPELDSLPGRRTEDDAISILNRHLQNNEEEADKEFQAEGPPDQASLPPNSETSGFPSKSGALHSNADNSSADQSKSWTQSAPETATSSTKMPNSTVTNNSDASDGDSPPEQQSWFSKLGGAWTGLTSQATKTDGPHGIVNPDAAAR